MSDLAGCQHKAVNPPRPPYVIRQGTLVSVSPVGKPEQRQQHRMRKTLQFDKALCHHGPDIAFFRHAEWNISVLTENVVHHRYAVIHALKIECESNVQLVIWPDHFGLSSRLRAIDGMKTLLDIEVGDQVRWYRKPEPLTVSLVSTYRTNIPGQDETVVKSGKDFLDSMNAQSVKG